ncbi:uncharacterized protein BT62DRAFT_121391 [Guyanagaster necrorhizus]|uniref:Uncharacterized protein n=1 Tax=Guyanagaster necrorhizus TaxID=856835 RepID=A0A9P7VS81_9AGAR|nr:uncharacterized protein BT62DRAFT_121391 [Guyanagaster necrorhizus MCA 3950]KAG7446476.1 hypothetical protein BT62DRAFT_121391 [Guyanagaster necrorhizus MCA 3950]
MNALFGVKCNAFWNVRANVNGFSRFSLQSGSTGHTHGDVLTTLPTRYPRTPLNMWQLAHRNPCQIKSASSLVKFKRVRLHFRTSIRVVGFPTRIEQRNIRKLYEPTTMAILLPGGHNSDGAKHTVTLSGYRCSIFDFRSHQKRGKTRTEKQDKWSMLALGHQVISCNHIS